MKSGFCAIIGRPNAGKSTLLNALLSKEVSIVTPKAQTTRDDIIGIYRGKDLEICFVDTPGIFEGESALDKTLIKRVRFALRGADCALYLSDVSSNYEKDAEIIESLKIKVPLYIVLSKIDLCYAPEAEKAIAFYKERFPDIPLLQLSALKNFGLKELKDAVASTFSEGLPFYEEGTISDKDRPFEAKEVIRQKLLHFLHQEIPHQCAVDIKEFHYEKGAYFIKADIVSEKENQKAIIIGKNGEMIKKISMAARSDLEKRWKCHVTLILNAKSERGWRDDPKRLAKLGYGEGNQEN